MTCKGVFSFHVSFSIRALEQLPTISKSILNKGTQKELSIHYLTYNISKYICIKKEREKERMRKREVIEIITSNLLVNYSLYEKNLFLIIKKKTTLRDGKTHNIITFLFTYLGAAYKCKLFV